MIATISDQDHVITVCKPGAGPQTCRYLGMSSGRGWVCYKHTGLRARIDQRVETMTAQGDNCEGLKGD